MFEDVKVFVLHKGVEIGDRDQNGAPGELSAVDNLIVQDPVFDEDGDLVISNDGPHGHLAFKIRQSNIAYEIVGDGEGFAGVLRAIRARGDCHVAGDLSALDGPQADVAPIDDEQY